VEPDATAAGVFKYSPPYPTSNDARGGCGRIDNLGSPLADAIQKQKVLAAPDHGLSTPSGIVGSKNGHFFVASVISGTINEYDADWQHVQTVLRRRRRSHQPDQDLSTGTPLGITVDENGTLYTPTSASSSAQRTGTATTSAPASHHLSTTAPQPT
jgi:hypothetical protein